MCRLLPPLISCQHNLKTDMNDMFMIVQRKNPESCASSGNSYHTAGPSKINIKLCQAGFLDIFLLCQCSFHIPTLKSLGCFCVHLPEFEMKVAGAEKSDGLKGQQCELKQRGD